MNTFRKYTTNLKEKQKQKQTKTPKQNKTKQNKNKPKQKTQLSEKAFNAKRGVVCNTVHKNSNILSVTIPSVT